MALNYSSGQILLADRFVNKEAHHLIVYLYPSDEILSHFIGLMLTHDTGKGNIKMEAHHFTNGFNYQNTHVVNACLLKPEEWGPFTQIGNLTQAGLNFIYENVDLTNPVFWLEYDYKI